MLIDIVFLTAIAIGAIKGIQRGFVVAIFSIVAIIIGLAAAIKLSAAAAAYAENSVNISGKWLPVISFLIVFLAVVLLVRLGAKFIQKSIQIAFLGWLDRLAGAILYVLLYCIVLSVLMFFTEQLELIKNETIAESKGYPWIRPIGPYVINGIGVITPFFQDMFRELQDFFEKVSKQLPPK